MTVVCTQRLVLRPMTHADIDTYIAYRSDPATLALLETRIPPTAEAVHASVDAMRALGGPTEDEWFRFAVALRENEHEMIGDVGVGIKRGGGIAEIGYVLRAEYRGSGYASDAAGALVDHLIDQQSIHRVEAVLSTENMASMRVLESIGMQFESITRLSCCVDGVWEDDLHYAMLADDRRAWLSRDRHTPERVELAEVSADDAEVWGGLATHHSQEAYVAPMLHTFRDALFPESVEGIGTVPWMRGIRADGTPVGFLMTSTTYGVHDGCWYLWRLLIDRMHQRRGIGARAMASLFDELRAREVPQLFTSCGEGPGSPRRFYEGLGFVPTGGTVDEHETELVLSLNG
jgi:RimJ/RimL family protein N-acetyltransferase